MTMLTDVEPQRLVDEELKGIFARWRAGLNGDGAVIWYPRDVGVLLREVIALRQIVNSENKPKPEPQPEPPTRTEPEHPKEPREDQEVIVTGLPTDPAEAKPKEFTIRRIPRT